MMRLSRTLLATALLLAVPSLASAQTAAGSPDPGPGGGRGIGLAPSQPAESPPGGRVPLLIPGKTSLYQRVIVRPGATVQPQPGALPAGATAKPVPGFTVLYVYGRQGGEGDGWVEVGRAADGRTEGWIPAAKAIPWQHTMVGAFANPAGRGRVLFLDTEANERALALDPNTAAAARALRERAATPNPAPVVALEPDRYVDIKRQFYLLPILNADLLERENGPPLRLLEVISAPADQGPPPAADPAALRNFKAGVMFVIDTTMSMQPYIERTRNAVRSIVGRIQETAVRDNFRFGLIAYRDSLEDSPGLEYATRTYAKPDFSRPAGAINAAIAQVGEARASSSSFAEDPAAGLKAALDEVDWNQFGGRYIILITDASARPGTHRFSVTRLNLAEIREIAKAKGVAVFAIHIKTPAGRDRRDHDIARSQYEELTRFGGAGSLYFPVENGDPTAFAQTVEGLSTALLQQVAEATGRPVAGLQPQGASSGGQANRVLQDRVQVVANAMRLSYLGRAEGTRAPDVVRSWTTDRDLDDTTIPSLEVRVLLTRNQLSDLAQALGTVLQAGLAGRTEPRTFFTQLRAAFAAAARDPQRIARADRIGALLGEYLEGLPYRSEVMDITEDDWLAMGSIAQAVVLNSIEAKLRLYQEFQSHPDLWVDLSGTRSPGEAMFPVPIEALP